MILDFYIPGEPERTTAQEGHRMKSEALVVIPKVNKDTTECAIEMMPLVLCKNCKYGDSVKNAKGEPMIECGLCNEEWLKEPDWFCADGIRGETND